MFRNLVRCFVGNLAVVEVRGTTSNQRRFNPILLEQSQQ
ncbi:MAG: hypothetical protein ACI94Y_002830 [Maribacter sp.]|jgi:hypothetical protein